MKKDKHEFLTNKEDIISWLDSMKIKKGAYVIFDDLSVSVNANVILENKKLKYLPIQFNDILGNFDIYHNQLTSLKGCPQNISGNFYANNNLLTTLEYAPKEIGELYNVSENQIKKLGKLDISCEIFQINDNPLTQIKFDEIKHLQTQYLYISSHLYRTFDYKTEDGRINFNIDPDYIEVSFERFKNFLEIKDEKAHLEKKLSMNMSNNNADNEHNNSHIKSHDNKLKDIQSPHVSKIKIKL